MLQNSLTRLRQGKTTELQSDCLTSDASPGVRRLVCHTTSTTFFCLLFSFSFFFLVSDKKIDVRQLLSAIFSYSSLLSATRCLLRRACIFLSDDTRQTLVSRLTNTIDLLLAAASDFAGNCLTVEKTKVFCPDHLDVV